MLPGGRLRLSPHVTLKLITPPSPSKPELSKAVRTEDAPPLKIVIPARGKRRAELPTPSPSPSVDHSISTLPAVEKSGIATEISHVAPGAPPLHIIIPPVNPASAIMEEIHPMDAMDALLSPISPPLSTPPQMASKPLTSPLRARFSKLPVRGPFRQVVWLQNGGFASAWAVEDMTSNRLLCLKMFKRERLEMNRTQEGLLKELEIYKRIAATKDTYTGKMFIMQLEMSFRTDEHVCFAMELMTADLGFRMYQDPAYCRANCRRWSVQLALGIQALHDIGIMHRDIKTENVLIDVRGNVRIADFGISFMHYKPLNPRGVYTSGVAGTAQCMAPEVLRNRTSHYPVKYGVAVDWWSFGCVLYELVATSRTALFENADAVLDYASWITKRGGTINSFPPFQGFGECLCSLFEGLLRPSPSLRYGFQDIKKHVWFFNAARRLSEFDDACERALGRKESSHWVPDLTPNANEAGTILTPLPAVPPTGPWRNCLDVDWVNPRSGL